MKDYTSVWGSKCNSRKIEKEHVNPQRLPWIRPERTCIVSLISTVPISALCWPENSKTAKCCGCRMIVFGPAFF